MVFSQEPSPGYTLYTPGGGGNATTYLKDIDGSIYNSWPHQTGPASMPYLVAGDQPGFENTLLYYPCQVNSPTMENGGVGGQVEIYNWNGDLIWEYELSDDVYQHHHDIEPLPNGNFLIIAWERTYYSEWTSLGRTSVNNSLNQMWFASIFEIYPNLDTGDAEIVWEWHLKDHLIQDIGPEYNAFYGNISEHPELMDINCGTVGGNGGPGGNANGDWMHINAIHYNEHLDQIVLSSRHQDELYIIDHSTTIEEAASHSGGSYGMGGDFLYRWGNPQNYDRGNSEYHKLADQHSINWIPEGYPGEGNLILFNNFYPSSQSSSVCEITTPLNNDGTYIIEDNQPFGPDDYTWYHSGGFSSQAQGGAFRLANGNTLITEATESYIFEVTPTGETVWDYDYPSNMSMIARAERYTYDQFDNASLNGDINGDSIINILDIIMCINIILGVSESVDSADLNQDGIINILDVVTLVNLVLGTDS